MSKMNFEADIRIIATDDTTGIKRGHFAQTATAVTLRSADGGCIPGIPGHRTWRVPCSRAPATRGSR